MPDMEIALASLDLATLITYRDEAIAALHTLNIGKQTVSIAHGDQSRSFAVPRDLERYIAQIQSAIDNKTRSPSTPLARRPIYPGTGG